MENCTAARARAPAMSSVTLTGSETTTRTAVSDRLEELSKSGVDEFVAAIIDADPETRARARALLRACDQS